MVSRLTSAEFTQSLRDKKLDVADPDPRLAGLDLKKADLNHDGKISGAAEAAALFREVDRFDDNGDASSVSLTSKGGALAATIQARDSSSPRIGSTARPTRWSVTARRSRCS